MEQGPCATVLGTPRHLFYTRGLIAAVPRLTPPVAHIKALFAAVPGVQWQEKIAA